MVPSGVTDIRVIFASSQISYFVLSEGSSVGPQIRTGETRWVHRVIVGKKSGRHLQSALCVFFLKCIWH